MRRAPLWLTALALLLAAPAASASPWQESTFQDDNKLIFSPEAEVAKDLDTLAAMGVDRLRVSVFWKAVAPAPDSPARPAGFDAANPAAYPRGAWDRYDTLLRLARARGLAVNFNLTGPAPNWATGTPARADIDETYKPSPAEFGAFVRAAGARFTDVDFWTVWNEPNHPGWLTPQWYPVGDDFVEGAPRLYRALLDEAWAALQATGHGDGTILIGETAPKGVSTRGLTRGIAPGRFLRRLYCLDDNLQFLRGARAEAQGCPASDAASLVPARHPALFEASGYAHHPYELTFAPTTKPRDADHFTIANLSSLTRLLTRVRARYGRPGGVPLHLTEFGYQTNPPDRLGVSFARQAAYLAQSEYLAYRNRNVRTLAQFLLVDDVEPIDRTFQSGLLLADRTPKPAFEAYKLPVALPRTTVRRGSRLTVWGFVRVAPNGTRPKVDVLVDGRRVARRTASTRGYLTTRVRVRRSGNVRLRWNGIESRPVRFTVRRR